MGKKAKKVKVRQFWNIDPSTKVEQDETKEYNRSQAKRDWLDELDQELTEESKHSDAGEEFPE